MKDRTTAQPEALLGWMGSLADPTRLRLLRLLDRHALGVVELCDVLQLPQSTVSRHLKVLADEGWVGSQRQATTNLYRVSPDTLAPAARKLWHLARDQTDGWATVQQDELRLARRLAERDRDGQAFFAGAAGQWDKLRSELYGERFGMAALLACLPPESVVADLGCGTGNVTAAVAPFVERVYAVDNSPAMLKAAKRNLAPFKNAEICKGDLTQIPLEDASCDAALLLLVLAYMSEPAVVLSEMARILKPGGRAIVVDLLPHDRDAFRRELGQFHMGFEARQIAAAMERAGLRQARVQPLPPEPSAKGPAMFLARAIRQDPG